MPVVRMYGTVVQEVGDGVLAALRDKANGHTVTALLPASCHVGARRTGQNLDQRARLGRVPLPVPSGVGAGTAVTAQMDLETEVVGWARRHDYPWDDVAISEVVSHSVRRWGCAQKHT